MEEEEEEEEEEDDEDGGGQRDGIVKDNESGTEEVWKVDSVEVAVEKEVLVVDT